MGAVSGVGQKPVQPQRTEAQSEAAARPTASERDERVPGAAGTRSFDSTASAPNAVAAAGAIPTLPAAASGSLDGLIDRAGSMMSDLEKEIAELAGKPSDQINPAKMMQLQLKMTKVQQLFELVSNMIRSRHEMAQASIRNIV